jgi:hypothetical protein
MDMLENFLLESKRNKRTEGGCGNVAEEMKSRRKRNGGNMEGLKSLEWRYRRTLLLFLSDVGTVPYVTVEAA